ncbi:TraE protein [Epsilonproteobacteria bacterium SCGC AD-311-C15]|nr:TraE protein [Epsilonproteobacteria bacterium SCGC AD-311-C15]
MKNDTGKNWLDMLDNLVAENSKMSLFLMVQLLMIVLLIIGYMKMIDKIQVNVELPKTIKESGIIIVGKEYGNDNFFTMWGREDIELISKFNQKTIKDKMEYLKSRMYPPFYYKHEKLFKDYEKQVSSDLISQKFTFARENIVTKSSSSGKEASIFVKGFYDKTIDEEKIINAQPCEYDIGYIIEGGHIYVSSFKTTCK